MILFYFFSLSIYCTVKENQKRLKSQKSAKYKFHNVKKKTIILTVFVEFVFQDQEFRSEYKERFLFPLDFQCQVALGFRHKAVLKLFHPDFCKDHFVWTEVFLYRFLKCFCL